MHPSNYIHYPFIPYWNENKVNTDEWFWRLEKQYRNSNKAGISLYIHLPFCEKLCNHCSFSPYITKKHGIEKDYVDGIIKEWWMYPELFKKRPVVNEIYIGGGTPTFFSPSNLDKLMVRIKNGIHLHPEANLTFEGHYSQTTEEHLKVFRKHGFNTIRLGIAGLNEKTQHAINRNHKAESIEEIVKKARFFGIENVHLDLLYGLPFQNRKTVMTTAYKILKWKPERISFYPYQHKPNCYPAQKKLDGDIPFDVEIKAFEDIGSEVFTKEGYLRVSNDLYILQSDPLYRAYNKKKMKKRLFGFSSLDNEICIGLGAGAVSECGMNYVKNLLLPKRYLRKVEKMEPAFHKGYFPYKKDEKIMGHLNNLINKRETVFGKKELSEILHGNTALLEKMSKKRWLSFSDKGIKLRKKGLENFTQILGFLDKRKDMNAV